MTSRRRQAIRPSFGAQSTYDWGPRGKYICEEEAQMSQNIQIREYSPGWLGPCLYLQEQTIYGLESPVDKGADPLVDNRLLPIFFSIAVGNTEQVRQLADQYGSLSRTEMPEPVRVWKCESLLAFAADTIFSCKNELEWRMNSQGRILARYHQFRNENPPLMKAMLILSKPDYKLPGIADWLQGDRDPIQFSPIFLNAKFSIFDPETEPVVWSVFELNKTLDEARQWALHICTMRLGTECYVSLQVNKIPSHLAIADSSYIGGIQQKPRYEMHLACSSLCGAIWAQIASNSCSRRLPYKVCNGCEALFYPRQSNTIYCDDCRSGGMNGKSNRGAQRVCRQKKKMKELELEI